MHAFLLCILVGTVPPNGRHDAAEWSGQAEPTSPGMRELDDAVNEWRRMQGIDPVELGDQESFIRWASDRAQWPVERFGFEGLVFPRCREFELCQAEIDALLGELRELHRRRMDLLEHLAEADARPDVRAMIDELCLVKTGIEQREGRLAEVSAKAQRHLHPEGVGRMGHDDGAVSTALLATHRRAVDGLVEAYRKHDDLPGAVEALRQLLSETDVAAVRMHIHLALASVFVETGKPAEALEHMRAAMLEHERAYRARPGSPGSRR